MLSGGYILYIYGGRYRQNPIWGGLGYVYNCTNMVGKYTFEGSGIGLICKECAE